MVKKILILFLLSITTNTLLYSQNIDIDTIAIESSDSTLTDRYTVYLNPIDIIGVQSNRQKREYRRYRRRYSRLYYRVKKVYPLAKIAGERVREYNTKYCQITDSRERKKYAKDVEEQILKDFEGVVRKLSITDGRILIKLIDRETGTASYSLIKEFRGGLSAVFWQSIARIFGQNLKDKYDTEEDIMIEKIIEELTAKGY